MTRSICRLDVGTGENSGQYRIHYDGWSDSWDTWVTPDLLRLPSAGVFRLTAAFGYGASEPTGLPYLPTDADVECVDDTASVAYNTVRERTAGADWTSHEEMRRRDGLYRIGVVVAHNGPGVADGLVPGASGSAVRGGGSCIFLHVWNGPGSTTSGCTAMPDAALQEILAWLDADAEPVLVQLPQAELDRLRTAWALP